MLFDEKTLEACRDIRCRIDSLWSASSVDEINEIETACRAKIHAAFLLGYISSTNREMWMMKLGKEYVIAKIVLLNREGSDES